MKKEMMLPAPRAPLPETIKDPQNTFKSACGTALLTYCPRTACGGAFYFAMNAWALLVPATPAQFIAYLKAGGIELPEGFEARTMTAGKGSKRVH